MKHGLLYMYEWAEWNIWPEHIPGYLRTNKRCPVCGSSGAFGATRSQYSMYCIDCGATWKIKEVIIKHGILWPAGTLYPDQRAHAYKSGWFEYWDVEVPDAEILSTD